MLDDPNLPMMALFSDFVSRASRQLPRIRPTDTDLRTDKGRRPVQIQASVAHGAVNEGAEKGPGWHGGSPRPAVLGHNPSSR